MVSVYVDALTHNANAVLPVAVGIHAKIYREMPRAHANTRTRRFGPEELTCLAPPECVGGTLLSNRGATNRPFGLGGQQQQHTSLRPSTYYSSAFIRPSPSSSGGAQTPSVWQAPPTSSSTAAAAAASSHWQQQQPTGDTPFHLRLQAAVSNVKTHTPQQQQPQDEQPWEGHSRQSTSLPQAISGSSLLSPFTEAGRAVQLQAISDGDDVANERPSSSLLQLSAAAEAYHRQQQPSRRSLEEQQNGHVGTWGFRCVLVSGTL